MSDRIKLFFVAAMLTMFFVILGPYLWRSTKIWLLSCPLINHLSGCDCAACKVNAPRIVNGVWREEIEND